MPTKKPKVSGYIPQHLFNLLINFKDEQGHKSVSEALIAVLSQYFGVEQKVDYDSGLLASKFVSAEEFAVLQDKVEYLSRKVENISDTPSSLPSEPKVEPALNSTHNGSSNGEPESEPLGASIDEPKPALLFEISSEDTKVPQKEQLMGKELAARLSIKPPILSMRKKELTPEKFLEYTRKKDPDGIGWIFAAATRLYHPEKSLPVESLSELPAQN